MKKLTNKIKGFTLTELAIVIAVIAILIAVLVPTFISLINSANESNDVITVRNMNTVLSTETDDIEKPTDALQIVYEEGGYSVANMTPKSTGKIVYDELTTSFVFVYSDGTTYPENVTTNFTAYTTWELVSTSDIEADENGEYHFEKSSYANNSIILKGSDWAGKTVYANYGVELWNDNDTSTTLNSLYVVNTDSSVQTAETGSVSLAKSAIKTAGSADSARNIIVNVRTNYLSYSAEVYNISDHSTVNTLLSTAGKGTYYQYGTTNAYDITNSSNANVVVCNEKQADKINNNEVAIITTSDVTTSDCISDSTGTVTVSIDDDVTTIVVALSDSETVQVTITEEGTVTITAGDTEITVDTETTLSEVANNTGLGTEDYPYLIASEADYDKVNNGGYCKVTADIKDATTSLVVDAGVSAILDLNGKTIISTNHTVDVYGTLEITDSTDNPGTIENDNTTANKYTIYVRAAGTLTVEKIAIVRTCESTSYYAVSNAGKFTMNSGSITSFTALYSAAETTINGGSITGTSKYAVYVKAGTLTVEETDADNNPITISGTTQGIYLVGGTVNIYGGKISSSSTSSYGIYMYNTSADSVGAVNIYGGSITSGKYGIYSNISDGTINISDCEISGSTYGVYSYAAGSEITVNNATITGGSTGIYSKGTLTVNSGTITGTKSNGIGISNDGGAVTINGGTISGSCTSAFAVVLTSTNGSGIVNKNSGTLTINGGNISGTWFGIYNNGTLEVYGGTITGGTIGIFATATTTKVTIGKLGAENKNITIKGATSKYESTENSSGYESAIYAKLGATVELYSGTIGGYRGVVIIGSSSKVTKLNVYGGNIDTTAFAVCNNGSNGSNYATISISGGTLTSTSAPAIYLPAAYGTTTISGGTIKGRTGVEIRGGSLAITGGTFEATAESFSEKYNGSGSTIDGAALAISTYNQVALTVTVENCTLTGVYAIYECYVNGKYDSSNNLLETATAPTYAVTVTVANITSTGEIYSQNTSIDD